MCNREWVHWLCMIITKESWSFWTSFDWLTYLSAFRNRVGIFCESRYVSEWQSSFVSSVLSAFARSLKRWPLKWKGAKPPPSLADSYRNPSYLTTQLYLLKLDLLISIVFLAYNFHIYSLNKREKYNFRRQNHSTLAKPFLGLRMQPNQRPAYRSLSSIIESVLNSAEGG